MKKRMMKILALALAASMVFSTMAFAAEPDTESLVEQTEEAESEDTSDEEVDETAEADEDSEKENEEKEVSTEENNEANDTDETADKENDEETTENELNEEVVNDNLSNADNLEKDVNIDDVENNNVDDNNVEEEKEILDSEKVDENKESDESEYKENVNNETVDTETEKNLTEEKPMDDVTEKADDETFVMPETSPQTQGTPNVPAFARFALRAGRAAGSGYTVEELKELYLKNLGKTEDSATSKYAFDNAAKVIALVAEYEEKVDEITSEVTYQDKLKQFNDALYLIPSAEKEIESKLSGYDSLSSTQEKMYYLKLEELTKELLTIDNASEKEAFLNGVSDEMYSYVYESSQEEVDKIAELERQIEAARKLLEDMEMAALRYGSDEELAAIEQLVNQYDSKIQDAKSTEDVAGMYDDYRKEVVDVVADDTLVEKVDSSFVAVKGISLNKSTSTVDAGDTETLTATVNPNNATYKDVTWTSSDSNLATVSNGVVAALRPGTVTITAKAGDFEATCVFTINVKIINVESVVLNKSELTLEIEDTETLTATVSPDNATDKTVTWTSSDESVATVSNGVVTALKVGETTVTATSGSKTDTCLVRVTEKTPERVEVKSVSLNKTTSTLEVEDTETLIVTVNPDNATDKTATWASSDETVITVLDGVVTAMKAGTATVTVTVGGKTAKCEYTVNEKTPAIVKVESITLNKTELTLEVEKTETLTAVVNPDNATDKTVTWTSSNESVATVSNGIVTAIKAGEATITAKAGEKTVTCKVTVKEKTPEKIDVTKVEIDKVYVSLFVDGTTKLTATVTPDNATNKTVTWETSDKSIATIDSNGNVKAIAKGSVTITATADGKTATCTIDVKEKESTKVEVTDVDLNKSTLKLEKGESEKLKVTITPDNATDKEVEWTSSNEKVATVDKDGKVKALKVGVAVITATVGDESDSCTVTVYEDDDKDDSAKDEDKKDENKKEEDKNSSSNNSSSNNSTENKVESNKDDTPTGDSAPIFSLISLFLMCGFMAFMTLKKKK